MPGPLSGFSGVGLIDVELILKHPQNWHTHPPQQIAALRRSIDEFGIVAPCTYNSRTSHLLDGHARLEIAVEDGQKQLYCRIVDWDERTEKRYMLAVDKITTMAGIDEDCLAGLLAEFQEDEAGLPPGWDTVDVEDVTAPSMSEITAAEEAELASMQAVPDAPDSEKVASRSKDGDIFRVGDHFVMCGDSTDAANIALIMGHADIEHVNLMFTDPPYKGHFDNFKFPNKDGVKKERTRLGDVKDRGLDNFNPDAGFLQTMKEWFGGTSSFSAFVFCNDILQLPYMRWCELVQGTWATLTWEKQQPFPKAGSHWIDSEFCLWLHKDAKWNDKDQAPDADRKKVLHFDRSFITKEQKSSDHPTPKPVELVQNQILLTSDAGDVICDPFCGTGTTGVAAQSTGRRAILMDIDPRSVDCTIAWLEAMTDTKAELIDNVFGPGDETTSIADTGN